MPALSVAQTLSGTSLGLTSGLVDLLVVETGGRTILYALNRAEGTLIELDIAGSGSLSVAGSLTVSGSFAAGSDPQLGYGSFDGGGTFLTLAGLAPASGQHVALSGTGALGSQGTLAGVGQLVAPLGLEVGGVPVIVSGATGGLAHYFDSGSGYAAGTGLTDAADRYLGDVAASAVFGQSGTSYVATVSATEHGVNIAQVTAGGLVQAGALGNAEGLPVGTPTDVADVTRLDETLLLIAASGSSSLSVVSVEGGEPALADHVLDDAATRIQGASTVAAVTYGDFAFAAAGGAEGGVSLFTVLPGGRLVHLGSVAEDETVPLDQIAALDVIVHGTSLQVFAGSGNEAGLTRLEYDLSGLGQVVLADTGGVGATGTSGDDQIVGSVVGEVLSGLGGDDILLDGPGNDTFLGGTGADLFVFTADGVWDEVADFERGLDRLDLSAFDFLYDVSQLTVTPTATGATLTFQGETIVVTTSDTQPLTAGELTNEDIFNVNRPPFLLVGREIIGTSANEFLNGGPGDDTIAAAGGDDSVTGSYGMDLLLGGTGHDTIDGGSDRDTLIGGSGDDLIFGQGGDDVIYGDDWS